MGGRRWSEWGWVLIFGGRFAAAYAITKALLPVRILGCVWATPRFAKGVVVPVSGWFRWVIERAGRGRAGVGKGSAPSGSPRTVKTGESVGREAEGGLRKPP